MSKDTKTTPNTVEEVKEVNPVKEVQVADHGFNIGWVMAKMDEVMKLIAEDKEVYLNAMYAANNEETAEASEHGITSNVRGMLLQRQLTTQKLLSMLEKMYEDVKPVNQTKKELPQKFWELAEHMDEDDIKDFLVDFIKN